MKHKENFKINCDVVIHASALLQIICLALCEYYATNRIGKVFTGISTVSSEMRPESIQYVSWIFSCKILLKILRSRK
jgi:hypothetical protein